MEPVQKAAGDKALPTGVPLASGFTALGPLRPRAARAGEAGQSDAAPSHDELPPPPSPMENV
ncbi:hypothetical protein GCM10010271_70060 [Streptomyces kurssanovii]|nr:hypothetical protein GCM10010271_70060 [Streptomyces kurssanovii]